MRAYPPVLIASKNANKANVKTITLDLNKRAHACQEYSIKYIFV